MKKTRYMSILLVVCIMAVMLAGCKKANPDNPAAPADTSNAEATEQPIGLANPMEPVDDSSAFKDRLDIYLDASQLGKDTQLFIYNDEMAEVQYTSPGMGDEDLEIRLRASKSSDDISGVYDANMEDVEGDYGTVDIKHRYSPETSTDIFDFEKDGTHYCITISGEASQMQIAEIMDNALLACGVSA